MKKKIKILLLAAVLLLFGGTVNVMASDAGLKFSSENMGETAVTVQLPSQFSNVTAMQVRFTVIPAEGSEITSDSIKLSFNKEIKSSVQEARLKEDQSGIWVLTAYIAGNEQLPLTGEDGAKELNLGTISLTENGKTVSVKAYSCTVLNGSGGTPVFTEFDAMNIMITLEKYTETPDSPSEGTGLWGLNENGKYVFYRDGKLVKGEFINTNLDGSAGGKNWYFTDKETGELVTGDWIYIEEPNPYNGNKVEKVWYHMAADGKMERGWIKDESGWKLYNLDSNGRMRKNMWINADAQEQLGMQAGIYHLLDDGAVQMNGWSESVTPGIYWYCNAGTGYFDVNNPSSWSNAKLW